MRLTIVRHARAGSKRAWAGRDEERPLDDVGAANAVALGRLLEVGEIRRLIASPALRCVQTLQPLAAVTGLAIETWPPLARSAGAGPLRAALFEPTFHDAVLCTHGEVLRPLLRALRRRHPDFAAVHADGRDLLAKGSAWVMNVEPGGKLVSFRHVPPTT